MEPKSSPLKGVEMYFPRTIIANIIVYEAAYGIDEYNKYFKASPEKVKEFVDLVSSLDDDVTDTDVLEWIDKNDKEFTPMTKEEILIYKQGTKDGRSIAKYKRPFNYPGGVGYITPGSKD